LIIILSLCRYDVSFIDDGKYFSAAAVTGSPYAFFPLGISLESASIEPSTNVLYAYLCTSQKETIHD
jgi:hypothetical protein